MVLDDPSIDFAGKIQLRRYGQLLQECSDKYDTLNLGLEHCSIDSDPLLLQLVPYEQVSILELISTENVVLNKVVRALTAICCESDALVYEATTKFYPALLLYGEADSSEETVVTGAKDDTTGGLLDPSSQVMMGRMLPCLQEISCFVDRCYEVVRNIVQQLAALFHPGPEKVIEVEGVHMDIVFKHLGELLAVLLTLDEIISQHPLLLEHWKAYHRAMKLVRHNPHKFNLTAERLKPLENLIQRLDAQLMSGFILQNGAEQSFDTTEVSVTRNSKLREEYAHCIRVLYAKIDKLLGDSKETNERQQLVSIAALCVVYIFLFRNVEKRSFKQIWDSHKKIPVFALVGDLIWSPAEFLIAKFPYLDKSLDRKAVQSFKLAKANFLVQKSQSLAKECQMYFSDVSEWLINMESIPSWTKNIHEDLDLRAGLFLKGVRYAYCLSNTAKTFIGLHVRESKPMTKSSVMTVFKLIEMVKSIQYTFQRHWRSVADSTYHILQHYTVALLKIIQACKTRMQADVKKYNERRLDIFSALQLAENALSGPCTRDRLFIFKLAISIASETKTFTSEEINRMYFLLKRIETVACLGRKLHDACQCSYLYWHRHSLFNVYLTSLVDQPLNASGLKYIMMAINDCVADLKCVRQVDSVDQTLTNFEIELFAIVKTNLLENLCHAVETDLRLSIHTHLQLKDRNPFSTSSGKDGGDVGSAVKPYSLLINLPVLRIYCRMFCIKSEVERYLEKTFYNLTTVALHDWRTYAEMKQLAKQKYDLNLTEAHLPNQQLEQGLDVLEIMRNIHIFVAKYMYNLNNQLFVEKTSSNKHLNTINIRHIANSIRTHGTGIMNTTVNFTYQFLRKKFYIFSQFLYDEQIKSRLLKDYRFFKEHKEDLNRLYPFEKAEKFNRGIRRLGLTADGFSYLDQFRNLITQIGNALGYVRMIRSGGLQCCAQAIQFIPDIDDIVSFEPMVRQEGLSEPTCEAARKFDSVLASLVKNFSEGTEYFKLLVEVFAPEFRSSKNVHLKHFFVIVPAVTVNYVEYMISCKEKMNKKAPLGAAFTDDGLAMGVAYILQLLGQNKSFDSLAWFNSVTEKYRAQRKLLLEQQQRAISSKDEKLQNTIMLSLKRLDQYEKEFDLLNYSLTSARIFFRGAGDAKEDDNEDKDSISVTSESNTTTNTGQQSSTMKTISSFASTTN